MSLDPRSIVRPAVIAAILASGGAALGGDPPPLPALAPSPPPAVLARPILTDLVAPLPPKTPLAVTVGGGVSLGAYQAGFLYHMAETAKQNLSALDLKLVSGASAGTINALLTVLAACRPAQDNPEDNLLWNIWHDVGFDRLFVPSTRLGATTALSNQALIDLTERLRGVWVNGISPNCEVVFAATATRVAETRAVAAGSLAASQPDEKIVLRIRGRGFGTAPEIHNYPDAASAVPQPLLALPRDQSAPAGMTEAFDRLREVLLASSAFPVAFPSVKMKICELEPGAAPPTAGRTECGGTESDVAFMDGGLYDNTPLRLAYHSARRLHAVDQRWRWNDEPVPPSAEPPKDIIFALIDKDNAGYPDAPDDYDEQGEQTSLLSFVASFAGHMVQTAQSKELAALYQEAPGFAPRVLSSVRHYPTASGHLANFFGFFEHELRRFDFYLGMYDARRMAEEHLDQLVVTRGHGLEEPRSARSAAYRCLSAAYASDDTPMDACAAPGLEAFRILLQVSLDRLYSRCERLRDNPVARRTTHPLCRKAMRLGPDEPRRIVPGVLRARTAPWRSVKGESSLTHMMRLLTYYEFPFKDLGLDGVHAGNAMSRVRERLGDVTEALAARQSFGERALLTITGKIALNTLHYSPPAGILHAAMGRGYELGGSVLAANLGDSSSLRWSFALEGKGLGSLFDSAESRGPAALSWAPITGPELELYGNAYVQLRLAARGGVQFSTRGWGTEADLARSSAGATLGLVQAAPSLIFLERLRVQAAWEQLIPTRAIPSPGWDLLFGVGFQFLSPFH